MNPELLNKLYDLDLEYRKNNILYMTNYIRNTPADHIASHLPPVTGGSSVQATDHMYSIPIRIEQRLSLTPLPLVIANFKWAGFYSYSGTYRYNDVVLNGRDFFVCRFEYTNDKANHESPAWYYLHPSDIAEMLTALKDNVKPQIEHKIPEVDIERRAIKL